MMPSRMLGGPAALILAAVGSFWAVEAAGRGQIAPADSMQEAGALLFETSCSSSFCHGAGGAGGQGPRLIDRNLTAETIRNTITQGRPGTPMPPFGEVLEPVQVQMLVAYVQSLSPKTAPKAAAAAPQTAAAPLAKAAEPSGPVAIGGETGDPAAGARLFFDSSRIDSCRACHSYKGRGGPVGPDLAGLAEKPATELFARLSGAPAAAEAFPVVTVTLRDGSRLTGVKRDESDQTIRLFDVAGTPPVLRTVPRQAVAKVENGPGAAVDHARLGYSRQELLDLAAFLKVGQPAK
jgi:putative heme-binding domain-containing protein